MDDPQKTKSIVQPFLQSINDQMHMPTVERNRKNASGWTRFNHYFKDYCEHSSIIGFNYVAEKRSKGERILWIILILIALAMSMYFIMEQYNKYDESPFIVSVATRETPIFQIPFPAITICPMMKSNKDLFNFTDVIHRIWDKKNITENETELAQYMRMVCDDDLMEAIEEDIPENFFFNDTFYEKLNEIDPTKDILPSFLCRYMGKEFECEDQFKPIILDGGICYTFNILNRDEIFKSNVQHYSNFHTGQPKSEWTNDEGYRAGSGRDVYPRRALQAGADNSLDIIAMALTQNVDYLCSMEVGYKITVHAPHDVPRTMRDSFLLPLGSATQVIITPNVLTTSPTVKSYKTADRKCYFSDEVKLKYFVTYTQGHCYSECLADFTLEKCSCVDFYMPHENGTDICGNSWRGCVQEAERELKTLVLNVALGLVDRSSICQCLPLCTQISYQTAITRYQWEWKEHFKANKKWNEYVDYTDRDLKPIQFSSLKIYFKDDQFYSFEKTELYGVFDFISNFGGLLGLFTGFSLLTVAEIIYYISVRMWCNKKLYNDISGPPDSD